MGSMVAVERNTVAAGPILCGPLTAQVGVNTLLVPQCNIKAEKQPNGLKLQCTCTDEVFVSQVQNLCRTVSQGLVSCCLTLNGLPVLTCNLTMGVCVGKPSQQGICITCGTEDPNFSQIIQQCGESIQTLLECGCNCFISINNQPVCCGTNVCER